MKTHQHWDAAIVVSGSDILLILPGHNAKPNEEILKYLLFIL